MSFNAICVSSDDESNDQEFYKEVLKKIKKDDLLINQQTAATKRKRETLLEEDEKEDILASIANKIGSSNLAINSPKRQKKKKVTENELVTKQEEVEEECVQELNQYQGTNIMLCVSDPCADTKQEEEDNSDASETVVVAKVPDNDNIVVEKKDAFDFLLQQYRGRTLIVEPKLKNIKHKFASKKLAPNFSNDIEMAFQSCKEELFRERYINNMFVFVQRRLPTKIIIQHIIEFFKISETMPNLSKVKECWMKLCEQGLINYKNFPLDHHSFIDLLDEVLISEINDRRKWFNNFTLLSCIIRLFSLDFERYQNKNLSLAKRVVCPESSFYSTLEKYVGYLKYAVNLWFDNDSFYLVDTKHSVVVHYKELCISINHIISTYINVCIGVTTVTAAELYSQLYETLIFTKRRLFLLTIPDIKLKLHILDSIIRTQFPPTTEMNPRELSLCRIINADFERLPPQLASSRSYTDSNMYSSFEIDEFVFILSAFIDTYLCHVAECGKGLTREEKTVLSSQLKPRVEKLTEELVNVSDAGKLSLVTRLKLKTLARMGERF